MQGAVVRFHSMEGIEVDPVAEMQRRGHVQSLGRLETKAEFIHFLNQWEGLPSVDSVTFSGETPTFPFTPELSKFIHRVNFEGFYAAFDVSYHPRRDTDRLLTPGGFRIPQNLDSVSNIRVSGADPHSVVRLSSGTGRNRAPIVSATADAAGNCHLPMRLYPVLCPFTQLNIEVKGAHPRVTVSVIVCPLPGGGGCKQDIFQIVLGQIHRHRYLGGMMGVMSCKPLLKSLHWRELRGRPL